MRNAMLAVLALAAAATAVSTGPAAAGYDYPWCAQGKGYGYPGECSYQTYQQCQASVSGRNLYCGVNPLFAFGQAQSQRRGRYVYSY
ncbi:DUF3551 domain-containing protein [Bradyrhizobium erythrophlei]|uniref:DUF3551 domain-containing protein n=1 Tax=Bradyrhizobium erythrophlei TaxID=1437360 RepID=UPI0035E51125